MTSVAHDYQYSVKVQSRFDLLASDELNAEDPTLLLQRLQNRQKQNVKMAVVKNETATEAPGSKGHSEKAAELHNDDHQDFSGARRGQPRGGRGDRRGPRPATGEEEQQVAPKGESWEGRGRGGPRGRSGFTRSRPQRFGGQREFDRHSGSEKTGVKAVPKKDGYGTGNWGTIEDELDVTMPAEPIEEAVEKEEEAAPAPEEPVEEEVKTLTLKEYKEQQKASKIKIELSKKGGRKANDGQDVFSNMVSINKSKPTEKMVDVLAETQQKKEDKPCFFEFGQAPRRERPPFAGGRGGRTGEQNTERDQQAAPAGGRGRGRGGSFNAERGASRGRGGFTGEGGRGGERRSFNPERGGGRGGERGAFNPERGGGRGRGAPRGGRGGASNNFEGGAPAERPSFRGSRGAPRGAGGFRGGRGGAFEGPSGAPRMPSTAPVMDSEMDFPALK